MKNRLIEEWKVISHKLTLLNPEIEAYQRAEERMKRIKFLVSSRKNIENMRQKVIHKNVNLGQVEK